MTDRKYLENFPFETLYFLRKLDKNNNREWFNEHRQMYEEKFLKPAQAFVEEVGLHLMDINPDFQAIPKINKSIFRIYRDARFSKNKNPYKTNLGIIFWEGSGKKMESSGLYFHIDPKSFLIALGMYEFTKLHLKQYRKIVSIEKYAEELTVICDKIKKMGFSLGGKKYKKVPHGFDKEYKYAELLLFKGVYAYKEENVESLKNTDIIKFTINTFQKLQPLHDWLMENIL